MQKWFAGLLALAVSGAFAAPLAFNWQQQRAEVTETGQLSSSSMEMENVYDIRLSQQNGGRFLLKFGPRNVTSIDGKKPDAELQPILATLLPSLPDILIDSDGEPLDIPDWESYFAYSMAVSEALMRTRGTQSNPKAEAFLNSPEMSRLLKAKMLNEPWGQWVWLWADIDPEHLPEPQQSERMVFGMPLKQTSSYRLINQTAQTVTLRYESQIQADTGKPLADNSLLKADESAWKQLPEGLGLRNTRITATLERQTLQPQTVEVVETGPKRETKRTYRFKWLPR